MKFLEGQCGANEQYSRRECLGISGVPEPVYDKDLEGKVLNLFLKIDNEKLKMSRRKDPYKIRRAKKKLKGLDLSSIGINSAVLINDSLCRYCKNLWAKCKKLWFDKFIHGFWTSNGLKLKIKIR